MAKLPFSVAGYTSENLMPQEATIKFKPGLRIGMIQIPIPIKIPVFDILPIPIRIRISYHTDSNWNKFLIRLIGKINDSDSDSNFCDSKRETLFYTQK